MPLDRSSAEEPGLPTGSSPSGVIGDFRIVCEIGRGGMGVVYEAEQLSLQRRVALKVLPTHVSFDGRAIERFRREAKSTAKLRHPGIVDIFAVGENDGMHWFAMELVDGTSLDQVVERMRTDAEIAKSDRAYVEMTVKLVAAVADALDHAHQQQVIHRDVKPSNILVRADGRPVLTDFGLAREAGLPSMSQTGEFAGTPYYVSPEQAMARRMKVDHRTDVFSLGVTLYEMLTLERPFPGETSQEVLGRIVTKEPLDPRRHNPRLAADLVTIVQKALEKDPDRRYASAAAFAADLRAFLDYRPIAARRASPAARLRRWIRREPTKAALIGVLLLAVPLVAALGGFMIAKQPDLRAAAEARRRAEIEHLLETAFLQLGQHAYPHAIATFERALALDPGTDEAMAGIVIAHVAKGAPADALAFLDARQEGARRPRSLDRMRVDALQASRRGTEAAALEKTLTPPAEALDLFLEGLRLARRGVEKSGNDSERVLSLMRRACLQTETARALYHFVLAVAAGDAKDVEAAREIADAVVALWPESAYAWFYAGYALGPVDRERAIAALRRSIALDPGHALAHQNLALALQQAGDRPGALAEFRRALEIDPDDMLTNYSYGVLLDESGDRDGAIAAYRRAIQRAPDFGFAHNNLGLALHRSGDVAGALAEYELALRFDPDNWHAHANLGLARIAKGDATAALAASRRAVELAPEEARTHDTLGVVLRESGDATAAIAAHRRALELDAGSALAHANLGVALLESGDPEGALAEYRLALSIDPCSTDAHARLVEFLQSSGDVHAQRDELERRTEVCPEDAAAWNGLAWFLVDPGGDARTKDASAGLVAARRAAELSKEADPYILDTLAEAHFATGEVEAAIAIEARAIELLQRAGRPDEALRATLDASIARYRAAAGSDRRP